MVYTHVAADWADISDTPTKQEKTYLKPRCTPFPGNMSFNPKTVAKRSCLNGNGDALNTVLMMQVLQLWQLRRPFFVLYEEFSKPVEIGINTCLILQNTLNVTVTALAVQNKREYPKTGVSLNVPQVYMCP